MNSICGVLDLGLVLIVYRSHFELYQVPLLMIVVVVVVTETIESSSTETLIGESYTYMPNFMGDKNSFYKKIDFSEYVQFERWEKTKCDAVKCATIRTRNN